jgi:energy-coupling factor transporter ATP-binding protein EcfA2
MARTGAEARGGSRSCAADYRSERYADWIAHVQTALPQVTDIEVREREDDHHAYFVVSYKGDFKVPSPGLSDGTLRILTLTLLPYLSKQPAILVTEEPENGIHPRAIEAVLQSLSSMYDSQVWVSSHSPVVLARKAGPVAVRTAGQRRWRGDGRRDGPSSPARVARRHRSWQPVRSGGAGMMNKRPCVILVADSNMAATFRGYFKRERGT